MAVLEGCKQGYTDENVFLEFAKDDDSIKKCNGCDKLIYDDGLCSCKYINEKSELNEEGRLK